MERRIEESVTRFGVTLTSLTLRKGFAITFMTGASWLEHVEVQSLELPDLPGQDAAKARGIIEVMERTNQDHRAIEFVRATEQLSNSDFYAFSWAPSFHVQKHADAI